MKYIASILAIATFALSLSSGSYAQGVEEKDRVVATHIFNGRGCFGDTCESEGDWCVLIILASGGTTCTGS